MKDYPFVKCLHPQSIVNPYTKEPLLVECGKCKACRVRKGSISALKCKLESLSHKYCNFITLTYSNEFVPTMSVCMSEKFNEPDTLVEITSRLDVGACLFSGDLDEGFINKLISKTNLPSSQLPHLSKRDAQLFIKRLRKNIDKYFKDEQIKVRYYLVGEYGPIHYRPHMHLLLWHSSDKLQELTRYFIGTYEVEESYLSKIVRESWRFGRFDVETSKGQCADYVAKYVNGSCSLPRIYKQKETKPFALHSNHLGEMVLQKDKKEIYELPAKEIVSRSIPIASSITDINLWRSLKTLYFPRCKNYSLRSQSERLYAYESYVTASEVYKSKSITDLAVCILDEIKYCTSIYEVFYQNPFDNDSKKQRLIEYFYKSCSINPHDLELEETYKKYFRKIYMELRLSKHFIGFCCDWDYSKDNIISKYRLIETFWKQVDYLNLTNQYEQMEKFCHDWFSDESDLVYFYANAKHVIDDFKEKPYYKNFHFHVEDSFNKSVKHKKLNDMNNIFADK